ncbi:hypothetical protein ACLOJK_002344 [Asimina triloba]
MVLFCAKSSFSAHKEEVKKETGLGLSCKKDEDFGKWYSEDIVACKKGTQRLQQRRKQTGGMVLQILELYRRIYEELLAIPVIKGKKSEPEKFAGELYTTTVEVSYVLKVAFIQVVVVSVPYKAADTKGIFDACSVSVNALTRAGFRVEADWSENHSPGWKCSCWEMKVVPLRIEIGPRD